MWIAPIVQWLELLNMSFGPESFPWLCNYSTPHPYYWWVEKSAIFIKDGNKTNKLTVHNLVSISPWTRIDRSGFCQSGNYIRYWWKQNYWLSSRTLSLAISYHRSENIWLIKSVMKVITRYTNDALCTNMQLYTFYQPMGFMLTKAKIFVCTSDTLKYLL